jgi:anaerobic magnesium-protoporphyrin IX monomethyl ester cyclase
MNIAASVDGKYDWVIVDGNCETDPLGKIQSYLDTGEYKYMGYRNARAAIKAGRAGMQSY